MGSQLFLTLFVLFGVACKSFDPKGSSSLSTCGDVSNHLGNALWQKYVDNTLSTYPLQENCKPLRLSTTSNPKGVVVMFHGFTACPQQYFDIAADISRNGWDVLLPVLPGHGHANIELEGTELPKLDNFSAKTTQFVQEINNILVSYQAPEKVVVGLSLGGAYALAAHTNAPNLYDRTMIIAPFFQAARGIRFVLGSINNVNTVRNRLLAGKGLLSPAKKKIKTGWGDGCESERKLGRAGICNFTVDNLVAGQQFGFDLTAKSTLSTGKVQFVVVENDKVVNNDRTTYYFNNRISRSSTDKDLCIYPKITNHSIASRFDNPNEDKFWLSAFERDSKAFITEGKFFNKDGSIGKWPACRI